jgi:hypothetical protein
MRSKANPRNVSMGMRAIYWSEVARDGTCSDAPKSAPDPRRQAILTPREETMKIRLIVALVGLAISFALPTFAQQKEG